MMRFLRSIPRVAGLAIWLAVASPAAYAQQPTPAALSAAKEVVGLTGSMALFNPLIAGVIEQAKILFLQQNPALSKDLNEIAGKMRADLGQRIQEVNDEVARIYATHFSEQELKDILAFYKSPAGKKLLAEQPQVAETSMRFARVWANKLSDEVIAKMREELKKKGHAM